MALTYRDRGTTGTQLDVLCGDIVIATVYKAKLSVVAGQEPYWSWTFYFTARPPGFEMHGTAASREIAQSQCRTLSVYIGGVEMDLVTIVLYAVAMLTVVMAVVAVWDRIRYK